MEVMEKVAAAPQGTFDVICTDENGVEQWRETVKNLVTNAGKNDILEKYFRGSGYSAGWFIGLIDNAGFSAIALADTMSSHAGWAEFTSYTESARNTLTFGAAASQSVTSVADVFNISAPGTINGVFVCTDGTKSGTTGVLYDAVSFSTPRTLANTDTLTVDITMLML